MQFSTCLKWHSSLCHLILMHMKTKIISSEHCYIYCGFCCQMSIALMQDSYYLMKKMVITGLNIPQHFQLHSYDKVHLLHHDIQMTFKIGKCVFSLAMEWWSSSSPGMVAQDCAARVHKIIYLLTREGANLIGLQI